MNSDTTISVGLIIAAAGLGTTLLVTIVTAWVNIRAKLAKFEEKLIGVEADIVELKSDHKDVVETLSIIQRNAQAMEARLDKSEKLQDTQTAHIGKALDGLAKATSSIISMVEDIKYIRTKTDYLQDKIINLAKQG